MEEAKPKPTVVSTGVSESGIVEDKRAIYTSCVVKVPELESHKAPEFDQTAFWKNAEPATDDLDAMLADYE